MTVFIGAIQTFKKYIAKFYDRKGNELYSQTYEALNIATARKWAYEKMVTTSDDSVRVKVNRA